VRTGPEIFDRRALRIHRERAARGGGADDGLCAEIAARLAERLDEIRRRFPLALDLGCRGGALTGLLRQHSSIGAVIASDLARGFARRAACPAIVADEEFLPFAAGTFDLVATSLALHWTNDLPGALVQIRKALKPDGLFLGAMFGGATLNELRQALIAAETALSNGARPRVSPFADLRDIGMLLQRAGFALPVVDRDVITVGYADPFALMRDLRGMGESNAVALRHKALTPPRLLAAAAARYPQAAPRREGITATFEVFYLTAWAPHADQPRARPPGSATASLAEALGGAADSGPADSEPAGSEPAGAARRQLPTARER